jgi:hypothetical protein
MKKYNVPATEVVALAGMGMLMASDPSQVVSPDPSQNIPGENV